MQRPVQSHRLDVPPVAVDTDLPAQIVRREIGPVEVEGDGSLDAAHRRGHSIEVEVEIRLAGQPNLIVDTGHRSAASAVPPLPYVAEVRADLHPRRRSLHVDARCIDDLPRMVDVDVTRRLDARPDFHAWFMPGRQTHGAPRGVERQAAARFQGNRPFDRSLLRVRENGHRKAQGQHRDWRHSSHLAFSFRTSCPCSRSVQRCGVRNGPDDAPRAGPATPPAVGLPTRAMPAPPSEARWVRSNSIRARW